MANETVYTPSNDKAYLLPRNPGSVFVCWTWSRSRAEAFGARIYEPEILVRLSDVEDKASVVESTVKWDSGRLYMKPPAEGRTYAAAVYAFKKDGSQEKLLESNAAAAPVSAPRRGFPAGCSSSEFVRKDP